MKEIDALFAAGGLSLERLRSFLAVAEAGSIAKAAKGDPTRQSQFSRQCVGMVLPTEGSEI